MSLNISSFPHKQPPTDAGCDFRLAFESFTERIIELIFEKHLKCKKTLHIGNLFVNILAWREKTTLKWKMPNLFPFPNANLTIYLIPAEKGAKRRRIFHGKNKEMN